MTGEETARLREELRRWVAERVEVAVDTVDTSSPLTALGFDSLKAAEFGEHVERTYGLTLTAERLFDGLTIDALTAEIASATPTPQPNAAEEEVPADPSTVEFSLFFFGSDARRDGGDRYRLVLDSAEFADRNGFTAVWTPERHFHTFGGLFPNPSVLGAALAVNTKRLRIRAGSVVLPLHDPVRVAEEWAVVDNLSGGRVDIAFATGWSPDDFVLAPERYTDRVEALATGLDTVHRLWRGERTTLRNGQGADVAVRIFPEPVQPELPTWITCSGSVERFRQAGALGANIITALLFQNVDELTAKLAQYRAAREEHGHDPNTGRVTVMVHSFVGASEDAVRSAVEAPFKRYLAESVDLWRRGSEALDSLDEKRRAEVLDYAFQRYYRTSALFGTPSSCLPFVQRLAAAGADEIACLVDFGVPDADVLASLPHLAELRRLCTRQEPATEVAHDDVAAGEDPLAELVRDRHRPPSSTGGVLEKARDFDLVDRLDEQGLVPFYRPLTENEGPTCVSGDRKLIMLGSNNYLGLTADPRVREAVAAAARTDGPSMSGSRLQNGSTPAHTALERRLAEFLGREDALLFTTGYQANVGAISALMGNGTTLVVDDECHASIHDGAAIGRCRGVAFRHNDTDDLARRLANDVDPATAMVMVDGVYSMSGDMAPLAELRAVCDERGVPLAVDDAHGLGMVGATGRGTEEELGVLGSADLLTGTFSKSLASIGGWVAGDRYLMHWLRYHGRSMLFSAAMPPTAMAAVDAALTILTEEPWRLRRTRELADYWRDGLSGLGFDTGDSRTAIVPVIVGDDLACLRFATRLFEAGVNVNCVVAPAVPPNKALLRTSVMATHDKSHLDAALECFASIGRELGVLP